MMFSNLDMTLTELCEEELTHQYKMMFTNAKKKYRQQYDYIVGNLMYDQEVHEDWADYTMCEWCGDDSIYERLEQLDEWYDEYLTALLMFQTSI